MEVGREGGGIVCVRRWVREEVCVNSIFMKENPTVNCWLGRMGEDTHIRSRTVKRWGKRGKEVVAVGTPN